MKIENKIVCVTSKEPWGDIWYSKQNYAFELSRNNRVIFIDPPRKWKLSNLISNKIELKSQSNSLWSLTYGNYLPVRGSLLNWINNYLVSRRIKRFLKKVDLDPDLLWAFDPMRLYIPRLLSKNSVYHCVDYYYFKFYGEKHLCKRSDWIFATSQLFLDEFAQFETPKCVIPHGISKDEFDLDPEIGKTIDIPTDQYALYIGVIDHRMDFKMYERAIREFPDQEFVFIGPLRLIESESADRIFEKKIYSNVKTLGPKHFKELKYYIAKSAFCISFMDMEYHANTVHHHKTLVYLAQGKPVFSFAYEEYKTSDEIMYMSNSNDELIESMRTFITKGDNPDLVTKRISYANQYTFENVLDLAGDKIVPLFDA